MDEADIYAKDGKLFAMIGGKECALSHTAESLDATKEMMKAAKKKEAEKTGDDPEDDDDDDEETVTKKAKKLGFVLTKITNPNPEAKVADKVLAQADIDAAKTAAVEEERTYRKMFGTVVASAKLTGAAADEFEKDFYGRPEKDLKFLAQHAIGERATPAGEGAGGAEPPKDAVAKAAEETRAHCVKKFATDASFRRRFRVNTNDAKDPGYIAGLDRFIAVESKCRADEASGRSADAEPSGDDPISRVLKNKSVCVEV